MSRSMKRRIHGLTDEEIEREAFGMKRAGADLEAIAQAFDCPTFKQLAKYLGNRGLSDIAMRLHGKWCRTQDLDDWNPDAIDAADEMWAAALPHRFEDANVRPCKPTHFVHVSGVCLTETAMAME